MLVRKYIHQRLQEYYAQPYDRVVGSIISSSSSVSNDLLKSCNKENNVDFKYNCHNQRRKIPFRFLLGEYHWNYIYGNLYRKTKGQWLTPSELFSPYYGQCIALWIVQQVQLRKQDRKRRRQERQQQQEKSPRVRPTDIHRIEIIELGGGRGTNAIDILDYLYMHYYDSVFTYIASYTTIDSSLPLLQYQNEQVIRKSRYYSDCSNSNSVHDVASNCILKNKYMDLYDYATNEATTTSHNLFDSIEQISIDKEDIISIVIGLEILDNLPHDKIRVQKRRKQTENDHSSHLSTAKKHNDNESLLQQQSLTYDNIVEQAQLVEDGVTTKIPSSNDNDSEQCKTRYKEAYGPVDPFLHKVLLNYPLTVFQQQQFHHYYWIPSIACGIINTIFKERSNTCILFADFDGFPNISTLPRDPYNTGTINTSALLPPPAIGEPIVTDMNDTDLVSYIQYSKTATDILFPTNFYALASYIQRIQQYYQNSVPQKITGKRRNDYFSNRQQCGTGGMSDDRFLITVQKQNDFLKLHGPDQVRATTSYFTGYSPMIHDFDNCSILTVGTQASITGSNPEDK